MKHNNYIEDLYKVRFTKKELKDKILVWEILTKSFFQKYVKPSDVVLDVGAGYCEFINNLKAKKKIALDINKDIYKFANKDIEVVINKCSDMKNIKNESVDVVFISNVLEHLQGAEEIEMTLRESRRVLKNRGLLLILQPNIKYAYKDYWDFFDHVVPLSHKGTTEALLKTGFKIVEVRPKFLPYSSRTSLPKWKILIKFYLKFRFIQNIFGKQMFVVARKE